jgi:hypothetical protein
MELLNSLPQLHDILLQPLLPLVSTEAAGDTVFHYSIEKYGWRHMNAGQAIGLHNLLAMIVQ